MRHGLEILIVAALLLGSAAIDAQATSEPLSGLPLAPGFERTGDPVQSYKFCGKSASIALYVGAGFADLDQENAWFAHALPHAAVFTASAYQNLHHARWNGRRRDGRCLHFLFPVFARTLSGRNENPGSGPRRQSMQRGLAQ